MKLHHLITTMLAGLSMMVTSCQSNDENEQHYNNKLFISAPSFTKEILFKAGDSNVQAGFSVAIAKPEAHDITVNISAAPELLQTYKSAYYDENVVLLSEEHYAIPETRTTIKSGSINSPEMLVRFINTGELDSKTTYVLPVTIKSVEGIDLMESAKTYYYILRGASLINVVCNISNNRAYPDFNDDDRFNNLSENTLEILFKANSFPNTLNTLMGIEGNYLLRIGDAGIPKNQLQIASSRNLTSPDLQLESNQWYHLAVTFNRGNVKVYLNGVEKLSGSVGRSVISLGAKHSNEESGSRCFWIGYSYAHNRYLDGVVSEARIWNRTLSAEEIQATNHFYAVAPDSEGLIAYWKFNEGSGKVVKDYSESGYNLTIEKEPRWEPVTLPQ